MRTISIYFLSVVLALSVYGCFGSRERGDGVDSGLDGADVTIETGGTGGRDTSKAGSGAIDGGHAGVGGSVVGQFDAAIIDAVVVQAGTDGFGGTSGVGGIDIDDDAGMNNAPCAPNCPDLEWVTIPGGTFMMGSAEGVGLYYEHPQHEVTVQSFKMLKTEVMVSQYGNCVDAGVCSEPWAGYESDNWSKPGRENHPVNGVDWYEAREFAEWLGGRLPSEAEWEYAARSGGRDIIYPWGDEITSCDLAVNSDCGTRMTMEVCSKPSGNTSQGLCDMAGNVWEWVEDDWHDNYSRASSEGQAWVDNPRGYLRVRRGGSWLDGPDGCRSALRAWGSPDGRLDFLGFRIVLDLR